MQEEGGGVGGGGGGGERGEGGEGGGGGAIGRRRLDVISTWFTSASNRI